VKLLFVLVAAGLVLYGVKEMQLGGVAKPEPQTITCRDLGEKGPGDNAHVRMTDYELLEGEFAVERSKKQSEDKWNKAWIPAIPRGTLPAPGQPYQVLVYVNDRDSDQATLNALAARPEIQGTVINEIESIDADVRKILDSSYPQNSIEKAWILEVDRKPKSSLFGIGMIAGGVLLFVLVVLAFLERRRRRAASRAAPPPHPATGRLPAK
jgi:hypothetical protein